MSHSFRIILLTILLVLGLYAVLITVLAQGIERLNLAREDELAAITIRHSLLRRLPRNKISVMLGVRAPELPQVQFNLPLPPVTDTLNKELWPEVSTPEDAPVFMSITTAHFCCYSYSQELLNFLASRIENYYENIINDTGLFEASSPLKQIRIFIFRSKAEYLERTRQHEWSAGYASIPEMAVYSYEGAHLRSTLPHELSHLMLQVFLGDSMVNENILCFNEGLAVTEEMRSSDNYRKGLLDFVAKKFRQKEQIPLGELAVIKPAGLSSQDKINTWYAEAGALVYFLIEQKGRERFNGFCRALKNYHDPGKAMGYAYSGEFRTIADIEEPFEKYITQFNPD